MYDAPYGETDSGGSGDSSIDVEYIPQHVEAQESQSESVSSSTSLEVKKQLQNAITNGNVYNLFLILLD